MALEPDSRPTALSRELIALIKAVAIAEERRDARLEAKLAELDARMEEATRVQQLITGGAARREARLRALEAMVESIAAERARTITRRPPDLPRRARFDPSVVDMQSADPEPKNSS
jgi:predicted RecB family endonuclease